ncbi:MAG: cytochrome c [Alphaproteobacteria bacterium]|nr:cytochrome c [Alphaproteobacteria bacterium]
MRKIVLLPLFLVACGGASETPAPAPAAPAAPAAGGDAPAEGAAPPPPEAAVDAGPKSEGEDLYKQYCIACHQADGKGMNGTLAGDFTSGRLGQKSDDELLASIKGGFTGEVGAMPAWDGVLTEDQMKAVLAYVKETYHPKG